MSASTSKKQDRGLQREAPPALIAAILLLVLLALGAGIFYILNNGWKTPAQQLDYFEHTIKPIRELDHGNRAAFDRENALRL